MKSIDQESLQNSLNKLSNVICQFEMNQILMKLSLLLLQKEKSQMRNLKLHFINCFIGKVN